MAAGCDANREAATGDPVAASRQNAEMTREAAADEQEVGLGTFAPPAVPAGVTPQSRLPADGDLAIFVPNTTLSPGSARLDPAIENPYGGDAEAIAAGKRHFAAFNCSGCHAPLGGGGMGPPLSDDQWIHGSEPAQIYLTIMHGRSEGMPAFGSMLPRRTVWELVAYVETLNDIDNYATELGFDAEQATSVTPMASAMRTRTATA
jgi:cytochrome c oxidase cbb3-type subunit 3